MCCIVLQQLACGNNSSAGVLYHATTRRFGKLHSDMYSSLNIVLKHAILSGNRLQRPAVMACRNPIGGTRCDQTYGPMVWLHS